MSISPVSDDDIAISSNRLSAGLQLVAQALASTPLDTLAQSIGKTDTTQVSRMRSGELNVRFTDAVRMLHAAGLKVVPADRICVARDKFQAMVTIASAAMSCPDTVKKLTWDES
ncbi:MAG: hypothetical protein HEQ39_09880 [Rhizobacter sp.]